MIGGRGQNLTSDLGRILERDGGMRLSLPLENARMPPLHLRTGRKGLKCSQERVKRSQGKQRRVKRLTVSMMDIDVNIENATEL